jgi:hypothetical protein
MGASSRASDSPSPSSLTCLTWLTPGNAPLPGITSNPVQITYATSLVNAGMSLQALMSLLGHYAGDRCQGTSRERSRAGRFRAGVGVGVLGEAAPSSSAALAGRIFWCSGSPAPVRGRPAGRRTESGGGADLRVDEHALDGGDREPTAGFTDVATAVGWRRSVTHSGAVRGGGHEASSWRRLRRPSKIFWRPTCPLAAASSRWRCRVGRNSMVVWKKVHDSQIDSKWQSRPTGRAQ